MRIKLRTTNFEHTPAIDALAEEKLVAPIEKRLSHVDATNDILLDIEFELTTRHHQKGEIWRAEAQLGLPHLAQELRAEATGESLREAVDIVKETLLREITRHQERERNE